jgi:hypothetical protein
MRGFRISRSGPLSFSTTPTYDDFFAAVIIPSVERGTTIAVSSGLWKRDSAQS